LTYALNNGCSCDKIACKNLMKERRKEKRKAKKLFV
jgi:hypothetical protein